jgi:hypothetical protein
MERPTPPPSRHARMARLLLTFPGDLGPAPPLSAHPSAGSGRMKQSGASDADAQIDAEGHLLSVNAPAGTIASRRRSGKSAAGGRCRRALKGKHGSGPHCRFASQPSSSTQPRRFGALNHGRSPVSRLPHRRRYLHGCCVLCGGAKGCVGGFVAIAAIRIAVGGTSCDR